jgi:predicted DNA binding protein
VPREVTAADVAAELGISKSAFLERLHRAERTLFRQLFA